MNVTAIIPARMGSSRFPGKPLAPICGRSMLEHVWRRAQRCATVSRLAVATCDREIAEAVRAFGAEAIMTSPEHQRAVDRVAEAARVTGGDIVVVIQGDEPLLQPSMIDAAVAPVAAEPEVFCSNLIERIQTREEFESPNTIKVVRDRRGNALYFSREPIPTLRARPFTAIEAYKQVCIMPFRLDRLFAFTALEPTALEEAESIDMLRLLEHGHTVRLVPTTATSHAVDVPADIAVVERLMRDDPLAAAYLPASEVSR
jgi:3-deoxy-manno-octulosonate cytidylyltransferase (CMP-KDO synthetase)